MAPVSHPAPAGGPATDSAQRFAANPLLRPRDVRPTIPGLEVACLLNPGAFRLGGRTGLLLRVAERPPQTADVVSTPVLDPAAPGGIRIVSVRRDDPDLVATDPRAFLWKGDAYLTTLSHLRLAWSDDGERFVVDDRPTLIGEGPLERFGIEDCRVARIGDRYLLTYTAVSPDGVAVGCAETRDWRSFRRIGVILPPHNKDCAIFDDRVGGAYVCLHRPSGLHLGGNFIWLARSLDLVHWGDHRCIARTRPGMWDSERIGAGAAPIRTPRGWLELYHGSDGRRYCIGALLLDLDRPERVIARSRLPLIEPLAEHERSGFFGGVVFTNGHVVEGDRVDVYYGAADEVVCGARLSIAAILETLR